jgi:hypothetical protein
MGACRYRVTPGYEQLPAARVKAVGLKPANNAAAAAIVASELPKAIATCESALSECRGPRPEPLGP